MSPSPVIALSAARAARDERLGLTPSAPVAMIPVPARRPTAVVYCEANLGEIDGKTANGLVRHSEAYEITSVIDSRQAGLDAGTVLGGAPAGIPVCRTLTEAIAVADEVPDAFIFGMAPSSGMLSADERTIVLAAIALGMDVVNGLHEFLNEDPEFVAAALATQVTIHDVRCPRPKGDLRMFTGRISEVTCPVIAVLGTDGAIGKRTTATILVGALNAAGIRAVLVSTGQTGLIQGGRHGIALDAIPAQFCSGEVEATVLEAFEVESPDVIVVEGQGALSHPAYLTSAFILRGARPHGVVLQHAPGRNRLGDFGEVPMPTPASEIALIETFAPTTRVIGVTLNHENLDDEALALAIDGYRAELDMPVTDALTRPVADLVAMVVAAFPALEARDTVDA